MPLPKDRALMPTMPTRADGGAAARLKQAARSPQLDAEGRRAELARHQRAGGGLFNFAG